MSDVALVLIRILLVILGFDRIAQIRRDGADLLEPCAVIVRFAVAFLISSEDLPDVVCAAFRRHLRLGNERLVEEIADEAEDLLREDQVLSGLFSAPVDVEDALRLFRVTGQQLRLFRREFLRPGQLEIVDLLRGLLCQNVLGDIVQLAQVEQRAGAAHLGGLEREIFQRRVRVGHAPFLVVGIQDGHQVFAYRFGEVTQFFIIAEAQFRVFSLGQLALGAGGFVHLHQDGVVAVDGQLPAELLEQFHVDGQRPDPLLAPHDVRRAHQVVVHHVGEMVRGQSRFLQDDHVLLVFGHGDVAPDGVGHVEIFRGVTGGTEAHNRNLARRQPRLDLF